MKVLVIRFSSLGDVVLSTVLLPNIRKHWPQAEISVLTRQAYVAVFDRNPHIDHVFVFDASRQSFSDLTKEIRESGYDVIFDLQNNWKSWLIRVISGAKRTVVVNKATLWRRLLVWFKWRHPMLSHSVRERILDCLKPFEVPVINTETQLFATDPGPVLQTFSIDSNVKLIGIAPGAKHATKRWTVEGFADAANRLAALPGVMLVILGDKSDRDVAQQVSQRLAVPSVNMAGFTSLPELNSVISKLSFLLTNDSGIMHMAEAHNVPLVALFGPTVREFGFVPYRKTSRVVETRLSCRPCTLHGSDVCPLQHHNCMKDIDVNAVLYATSDLL